MLCAVCRVDEAVEPHFSLPRLFRGQTLPELKEGAVGIVPIRISRAHNISSDIDISVFEIGKRASHFLSLDPEHGVLERARPPVPRLGGSHRGAVLTANCRCALLRQVVKWDHPL